MPQEDMTKTELQMYGLYCLIVLVFLIMLFITDNPLSRMWDCMSEFGITDERCSNKKYLGM